MPGAYTLARVDTVVPRSMMPGRRPIAVSVAEPMAVPVAVPDVVSIAEPGR